MPGLAQNLGTDFWSIFSSVNDFGPTNKLENFSQDFFFLGIFFSKFSILFFLKMEQKLLRVMSTQHKIPFICAHITSYRIFLKFATAGQPSINSEMYRIKKTGWWRNSRDILKSNPVLLITREFRHQPVFNSIHVTIYTWLPNCAKFEKKADNWLYVQK